MKSSDEACLESHNRQPILYPDSVPECCARMLPGFCLRRGFRHRYGQSILRFGTVKRGRTLETMHIDIVCSSQAPRGGVEKRSGWNSANPTPPRAPAAARLATHFAEGRRQGAGSTGRVWREGREGQLDTGGGANTSLGRGGTDVILDLAFGLDDCYKAF